MRRDGANERRETATEERDTVTERRDRVAGERNQAELASLNERGAAVRDREGAARDRSDGSRDRRRAAQDRRQASREHAQADIDGLTRVLRRERGMVELRSSDLIVRYGGDEFLCALLGADMKTARQRFDEVATNLTQRCHDASVSIGFAALEIHDTLGRLTERADADLYAGRRRPGARRDPAE